MADIPDNKKPEDTGHSSNVLSPVAVEVIAGGTSIAAGAVSARSLVSGMAYKNMSSLGAVQDMKPQRKEALSLIEQAIDKGTITAEQAFKAVDDLVEVNDRHAWDRFKKFGVNGFRKEWAILRTHQKVEVIAFASLIGGVLLGAVLPLMREWTPSKDKRDDANER